MIAWNSPLNTGFDIVFGVLPALYGILSIVGFMISPNNLENLKNPFLTLSLMGGGAVSAFGVIRVTFARESASPKQFYVVILVIGLFIALTSSVLLSESFTVLMPEAFRFCFISISIVAIKHIIMLTRGNA
jgi:hypothetical protein